MMWTASLTPKVPWIVLKYGFSNKHLRSCCKTVTHCRGKLVHPALEQAQGLIKCGVKRIRISTWRQMRNRARKSPCSLASSLPSIMQNVFLVCVPAAITDRPTCECAAVCTLWLLFQGRRGAIIIRNHQLKWAREHSMRHSFKAKPLEEYEVTTPPSALSL